jgi:sarcosine oxidase delta subunit
MRSIGVVPTTTCWHCSKTIEFEEETQTARYLYRGDQPLTVVVEDWIHCTCGAYQNIRRLTEISVEALGNV